MKPKLLILNLFIFYSSVVLADSPQLKYSTLLGNYWYSGATNTDRDVAADVDDEGNFYVFANQVDPPDSTWPHYDDRNVCRLLRINSDGSGVDLVMDILKCWVQSVECHSSGNIYLHYTSEDDGYVLQKITSDGEEIGKLVLPLAPRSHYIDPDGNIYITGEVNSWEAHDIPITADAMFQSPSGYLDIVIMKYNASFELVYCSFLGGSSIDSAVAIIGNADGNILLACNELSDDFSYLPNDRRSPAILVFNPELNVIISGFRLPGTSDRIQNPAFDLTYDPCTGSIYDAAGAVLKFSSAGEFQWIAYIDWNDYEPVTRYAKIADTADDECRYEALGIALDEQGNIYYNLDTNIDNFPVTADALYYDHARLYDVTVCRINPESEFEYATYFGGSGEDYSFPLATAFSNGVFYCAGVTNSDDFPVTPGAYLNERMNFEGYDIFAFAIEFTDFTVSVNEETRTVPTPLILDPPHPNPFNPATTISFTLPEAGFARLAIYNISGQLVRELTADNLPAGRQEFVWDGRDMNGALAGSGVYIARLAAGERTAVRKVTLVR